MHLISKIAAARTLLVLALALPASIASYGQHSEEEPLWSDEFEGKADTAPDLSKWKHMNGGGGWGNNELQYYTDSVRNARHDGKGHLVIEAHPVDEEGQLECWYGKCRFTSARISTKGLASWKYGRIEARMRLPEGQGVWPAFWMLGDDIDKVGWPACGEIDIMEMIGHQPSSLYGTLHGPGYSGASGLSSNTRLLSGKFIDGFNTFSIEWGPDRIEWLLNGKKYASKSSADVPKGEKWVFDHEFFIILNLAVGGNWPGSPDASTSFPARVEVDYVRVYEGSADSKKRPHTVGETGPGEEKY